MFNRSAGLALPGPTPHSYTPRCLPIYPLLWPLYYATGRYSALRSCIHNLLYRHRFGVVLSRSLELISLARRLCFGKNRVISSSWWTRRNIDQTADGWLSRRFYALAFPGSRPENHSPLRLNN